MDAREFDGYKHHDTTRIEYSCHDIRVQFQMIPSTTSPITNDS